MDTKHLFQAVSVQFEHANGSTIRVKVCQSFNSFTPIMFLFLFNKAHLPSLTSQLCKLLMETWQQMSHMQLLGPKDQDQPISAVKDKKFNANTSQNKQVGHLECCETASTFLLQLFHYIKESSAMWRTFCKYVHITKPLIADACGQDRTLLCRMAQLHANFHNSVQLNSINVIVDISINAHIGVAKGQKTMMDTPERPFWELLYSLQLLDKSPLFLSILPCPSGMVVDCIIPSTATAETHLVQMNCHLPGYLKFYIKKQGYNYDGIVDILNQACNPDRTATISQLTWDAKHKVVILPSEEDLECDLDEMECEPWLQTAGHILANPGLPKKAYNDPDHAFPLNSDMSVTTIHAKQSSTSLTSPDSSNLHSPIHSPTKEVVIINPATQDGVSTLFSMSKKDLIKMLLHFNHNNHHLSGTTVFAPTGEDLPYNGLQASLTSTNRSHCPTRSPSAVAMGE